MAAHDRACSKILNLPSRHDVIDSTIDGLIPICQWLAALTILREIVQAADELIPDGCVRHERRSPHLPVAFGVGMARVKWDAERRHDCAVPCGLRLVKRVGEEIEPKEFVTIHVIGQAPAGVVAIRERQMIST